MPEGLDIHIVMDNYSTHKTKEIGDWSARRPRWHVHFIPTCAALLNQVGRFFADLTEKQIKRRVHRASDANTAAVIAAPPVTTPRRLFSQRSSGP